MTRLLVIDDSELVRRLLQEGLTAAGFEVTVAVDANHGYSIAVDILPDLILLDVQLPDVTGFELCRVLRNRMELQHIPIIMVTGTAHSTLEKIKGFQLGADDYVQKPFEMAELVERIRAVLRRDRAPKSIVTEYADTAAPAEPSSSISEIGTAPEETPRKSSLQEVLMTVLCAPKNLDATEALPPIALPYWGIANALALASVSASVDVSIKPVAVFLMISCFWGLGVSVVVMTSSIVGISLGWRMGARLFSLAAIPLLLRLLGGLVLALITTLSPFYFSSGPALFMNSSAGWVDGLDLSFLWTVFLCGRLLSNHVPQQSRKAWSVAAVIWGYFIIMSVVARKFA